MSQPMPEHNPQPGAFPDAGPRTPHSGTALSASSEGALPPATSPPTRSSWIDRVVAVLFCIFCFEVGAFLIVYPWLDAWGSNYLVQLRPNWAPFLLSHQFRGAITGLGILNIFIAFGEVFRLRRFSEPTR